MAKAADKTNTPPRGFSLQHYFDRLRANGATRCGALSELTARLDAAEEVDPPLPPGCYLEIGPQDEVLVMPPSGGMLDGRQVYLYTNPFKPSQLSPAVSAAFSADDAVAPSRAAALIDTQVWLNRALKDHPQPQGQSKAAYARDLQRLMQKATVTRQWVWQTILRRLFD